MTAARELYEGVDGVPGTTDDVEVYVVGFALEGYCSADPRVPCFADADCNNAGLSGACLSQESAIDDIACAGSGGGPDCRLAYIANNASELTTQLQRALNDVIGGEITRTPTVVTNRTQDVLNGGAGGQYQIQATAIIDGASIYWTGELERTRLFCDADLNLVADAPDTIFNTRLESLTQTELSERRVFTNSGRHTCLGNGAPFWPAFSGHSLVLTEGMDPYEIAAACCVGALGGQCEGSFNADNECEYLDDPDAGIGGTLPETSVLSPGSCLSDFGFSTVGNFTEFGDIVNASEPVSPQRFCTNDGDCQLGESCATEQNYCVLDEISLQERLVAWVLGFSLTEIDQAWDIGGLDIDVDRTSRMGAFFHSTPALVGGADLGLPITGYERFREQEITPAGVATNGTTSELRDTVAERYTMAYVLSTNGLIHAFNAETGDEEWAFLPNSVLGRVEDALVSGNNLAIDGTPIVRDLRVHRNGVHEEWRTVLLTGFRGGGRGFVALDVTDPQSPQFLWELDAEQDARMGFTYGEGALGTVFLDNCSVIPGQDGGPCERGIAILPGGMPRGGISQAGSSQVGDVIYVVDVLTGTVLLRETPWDRGGILPSLLPYEPSQDPITGSVAAFDDFAGGLVSRAFVGDGAGRLWRLDLSSGDPSQWSFRLFFDPRTQATSDSGIPCDSIWAGALSGCDFDPIFFRPTIALRNGTSNAVVLYGFGNTDDLETIGGNNYIISLEEEPTFGADGVTSNVNSRINWMLELADGEKLTARPRIFNSVAYFATFLPDQTSVCERGSSRVYGLDFVGESPGYVGPIGGQTENAGQDSGNSIIGMLPEDPYNPGAGGAVRYWGGSVDRSAPNILAEHSTVFGLDIVQAPRCIEQSNPVLGQYGGGDNPSALGGSSAPSLFISESVIPDAATASSQQEQASIANLQFELETDTTMVVPFTWGYPVGN